MTLPRELGPDLTMRRATTADAGALAAFNADVLRPQDTAAPHPGFAAWTWDLLSGRHPTHETADTVLVEDRRRRRIVSSLMLVSQTWAFGGIPIEVGQPELVGTDPEYRGRGLVRAAMETLHGWSAARGQLLLAINGIPWFYRQFGYEMALPFGGGPSLAAPAVAAILAEGEGRHRARAANARDAGFLAKADTEAAARYLVTVPRTEALWRFEVEGRSRDSMAARQLAIVETAGGEPVGFLAHLPRLTSGLLRVGSFEVAAGVSWRAVWPAVLAYLQETGQRYAARDGETWDAVNLWQLGAEHPVHRIHHFEGRPGGYAYYVRVPDLPRFVMRVAPVLERRLAESPLVGHTGELTLGFYRGGLRLTFERGRLATAEAWTPAREATGIDFGAPSRDPRRAMAMFPDLTFLQLLFGARDVSELERAYPDAGVRASEARALLLALFPRQESSVWPVL
ncbi:MAG: GNAT family N-acetyltransferase [Candidatus Rokubacteria bacterium]|nr:GNAT family N-acetyltransferase [Candidatus Rokubacteria bacterium]